jgi:hypothetical protein
MLGTNVILKDFLFETAPVRQVYLTVNDYFTEIVAGTTQLAPDSVSSSNQSASVRSSSTSASTEKRRTTSSSPSSGYGSSRVAAAAAAAAAAVIAVPPSLPPPPASALSPGGRIIFVDGQSRRVGCVAVGGNPSPALRVYLNDRDITSTMEQSGSSVAAHGPPGLRHIITRTELRNGIVKLSPPDDGKRLRCVAVVPGLAANITETWIDVHCEYRFGVMYLRRSENYLRVTGV